MDKNRLCIFSFFDKDGYVDDYVAYLLDEISSSVKRIIIVVNGELDERGMKLLKQYTEDLYLRENKGFDAGAYKYILCQKLSEDEIRTYDEIVFCNDTFYGPFIPLSNIIESMKDRECDFWGLNGYFDWVYPHMQSYFLVFRKSIIEKGLLKEYFSNNIDGDTLDINHVYCQFENGLFDYLVRQKGMRCAKYVKDNRNYDLYKYSYAYLKEFQFPLVKKKVFSFMDCAIDNAMCTLGYIKYYTNYDLKLVLKSIRRIYGIELRAEDINAPQCYDKPKKSTLHIPIRTSAEIENFIAEDEFYIYGTGAYACRTYWRYAKDNNKFRGFIISDGQKQLKKELFGHPIKSYSVIRNMELPKILLGVSAENAEVIILQFEDTSKVLRIF